MQKKKKKWGCMGYANRKGHISAFAQSKKGILCAFTESLGTVATEYSDVPGTAKAYLDCADSLSLLVAYSRRYMFK